MVFHKGKHIKAQRPQESGDLRFSTSRPDIKISMDWKPKTYTFEEFKRLHVNGKNV